MLHKKVKLFVSNAKQDLPQTLSFHCLQFYASYASDCFQEIVLFKKRELSTWKTGNSQQKDLSPPHLDM